MSSAFTRKDVLNAALMMTGSTYITYFTGLVTTTLIARSLPSDRYGQYAYFVWMVGVLCVLINNALSVSTLRFVSEAIGSKGAAAGMALYGWFRKRQSACMLLVLPAAIGFAYFNPPSGWSSPIWAFIMMMIVASLAKASYMFLLSASKGFGAFVVDAASNSIAGVVSAGAVLVAFFVGAGLNAYLGIFVGTTLLALLLAKVLAMRSGVAAVVASVDEEETRRIWRFMRWTLLLILCNALNYTSISVYVLNRVDGAIAVGLFVIAATLTRAGMDLLSAGLSSVLMTSMSRAYGAGGVAALVESTSSAVRYFHFLGLIVAGVGAFWAAPVIGILYGSRYEGAVVIMMSLAVIGGVTFTDGVLSSALSVMERQRELVMVSVLSWGVTIGLSIALIFAYGITGAIIANVVSKAFLFACILIVVTRFVKLAVDWKSVVLLTLAGIASAMPGLLLVAYADSVATRLVAGLIYSLILLALSWFIGYWSNDDKTQLRAIVSKVPALRGMVSPVRT